VKNKSPLELLSFSFLFQQQSNLLSLSKKHKKSHFSNQRIKVISRARITQIPNILKLDNSIINKLEYNGDVMDRKVASEGNLKKSIKLRK